MTVKISRQGRIINAWSDEFEVVQSCITGQLYLFDEYRISREGAIELITILQRFVDSGSIEEKDESDRHEKDS